MRMFKALNSTTWMSLSLMLATLLSLPSCVTLEKATGYFDKHTDELAAYVDHNSAYTASYGAAYAAKHFPVKVSPPEIKTETTIIPGRLLVCADPVQRADGTYEKQTVQCPDSEVRHTKETIYLEDTAKLEALRVEYEKEQKAHEETKQQLQTTEEKRQELEEKNNNKFWALVAIGIFAVLYVGFKILSARVRIT